METFPDILTISSHSLPRFCNPIHGFNLFLLQVEKLNDEQIEGR